MSCPEILAHRQSQLQHNMTLLYAYDYDPSVIDTRISSCSTYALAHAIEGRNCVSMSLTLRGWTTVSPPRVQVNLACFFTSPEDVNFRTRPSLLWRIALRTLFDLMNT